MNRKVTGDIPAAISALEVLKAEFMRFTYQSEKPSPTDLKNRHDLLNEALSKCGGQLDGYWVIKLFYELESAAVGEINKLAALAQGADVELVRERFPALGKVAEGTKLARDLMAKHHDTEKQRNNGRKPKPRRQKTEARKIVEYFWDEWKKNPGLYKSVTEFDKEMTDKTAGMEDKKAITRLKTITDWRKILENGGRLTG